MDSKELQRIDFPANLEEALPPVSEKQRRINEIAERYRGGYIMFHEIGNRVHVPSGPVVDSTVSIARSLPAVLCIADNDDQGESEALMVFYCKTCGTWQDVALAQVLKDA